MLSGSKTKFKTFKAYRLYRKDFWGILLDKKQYRYRGCIYDILKYKRRFYYKIINFVYGGKKIVAKRYRYGGQLFLTKQRFRLFYNNMKTAQVGDLLALARRRRGNFFDFYDSFFGLLESRLDCLLVRSLFISNFKQARLFISRRVVFVNDVVIRKVGFSIKSGDVVSIKDLSNLSYFFKNSFKQYLNVSDFVKFIYGHKRLDRNYKAFWGIFSLSLFSVFEDKNGFFVTFLQFISKAFLSFGVAFFINKRLGRFLRKLLVLLVLFGSYKAYLRGLFWLSQYSFGHYYYKRTYNFLYSYNKVRLKLIKQLFGKPYFRAEGAFFWRLFLSRSDFVGDFDTVKIGKMSKRSRFFVKYKLLRLNRWKRRRRFLDFKELCIQPVAKRRFFGVRQLYFFLGYPLYMEVSYKLFRLILRQKPSFNLVPLKGFAGFRWVEFFRRRLYF